MSDNKKGLFGIFGKKEAEAPKKVAPKKAVGGTRAPADVDKAKAQMAMKQKEIKKKAEEVKKHVVVKGDTLSAIAKKYYNDAGKYMKIYEANKAVIGANPDLIKPGMELVIPKL